MAKVDLFSKFYDLGWNFGKIVESQIVPSYKNYCLKSITVIFTKNDVTTVFTADFFLLYIGKRFNFTRMKAKCFFQIFTWKREKIATLIKIFLMPKNTFNLLE